MMAWRLLIPNSGWILGAVIMLSVWSLTSFHASYRGKINGVPSREVGLAARRAVFISVLLIALSQLVLSRLVWHQLVWVSVCLVCIYRFLKPD